MTPVYYLVELLGLQPVVCRSFLPALDCFLLLHLLQLLVQSAQIISCGSELGDSGPCEKMETDFASTFEFSGASLPPPVSFVLLCRTLHPPLNNRKKKNYGINADKYQKSFVH